MTVSPVELRSDTFTRPTAGMRRAMAGAEVGDDVWNEDPTVHRLQARAADLMGKEAALFVVSGTMGNLIGLLSHTRPGDEVILGDQSHILWYEVGGAALVGGLQLRAIPNGADGTIDPERVRQTIRDERDDHAPATGCVAIENTHNRCGGAVLPTEVLDDIANVARGHGVPVHLDGARIFNAAVALDVPVARFAAGADSVTFCLSKGLGAPVGSILCGSAGYIGRARRWRKLLGGGMRQVGVLAAAGLVALEENVERLNQDHELARLLAHGIAGADGIALDLASVQSNIVMFDVLGISPETFLSLAAAEGVLLGRVAGTERAVRAVTCYEVDRPGIERAVEVITRIARRQAPALA